MSTKIEAARSRWLIVKQIRALLWCLLNGYRPVPGYTVTSMQKDGTVYIAMELEP